MNKVMTALLMAAALAATPLAASARTAQQEKMVTCNKEAKTQALKGEERKKFMKECLSAKGAPAAAATPAKAEPAAAAAKSPNAMTACNKAAEGKKGAERKKFMSECLKAKGPENMKK